MATAPKFTNSSQVARVRVAAANTTSDGSGTINAFLKEDNTTVFSGHASGSKIFKIRFGNSQATAAASSAMVVRVFISDSAGTNWRLLGSTEVAVATATRSVSAVGAMGVISFGEGLDIGSGVKIGVVQSVYAGVQDQMDYEMEYADYD